MEFKVDIDNKKSASLVIDKKGVIINVKGFNKNDFVIDKVFKYLDKKAKSKKAKNMKLKSRESNVSGYIESDEPVTVTIL